MRIDFPVPCPPDIEEYYNNYYERYFKVIAYNKVFHTHILINGYPWLNRPLLCKGRLFNNSTREVHWIMRRVPSKRKRHYKVEVHQIIDSYDRAILWEFMSEEQRTDACSYIRNSLRAFEVADPIGAFHKNFKGNKQTLIRSPKDSAMTGKNFLGCEIHSTYHVVFQFGESGFEYYTLSDLMKLHFNNHWHK